MSEARSGYERVLLKLSGEALRGRSTNPFDFDVVERIAREIISLQEQGVQTSVVIGGGNFIRGGEFAKNGIHRVQADYMGLLATVINGIALLERLESLGAQARLLSAGITLDAAEPFVRRRALMHLHKGRIVILTGGTGNPLFTTDTCAALRAAELGSQVVLKATKVDGIYDSDPMTNPNAKHIPKISYLEVLKRELKVMDAAAISLCHENKLPIIVFDLFKPGNILRVVAGERIGSIVEE